MFVKATLQQTKIASIQFHPEAFALEMLEPAGPQIAPPVIANPATNGSLTEVTAGFFTFDPFEALSLNFAVLVDATDFHLPLPTPSSGRKSDS